MKKRRLEVGTDNYIHPDILKSKLDSKDNLYNLF